MHDYMICIDENGSPYLAHALFGNRKGSQKKDHKYLERVIDKGKYVYLYTQDQINNWYNKSGLKQRKEWKKAGKEYDSYIDKINKKADNRGGWYVPHDIIGSWGPEMKMIAKNVKYSKTPLGKLETAMQSASIDVQNTIKRKLSDIQVEHQRRKYRKEIKKSKKIIRKNADKTLKEIQKTLDSFLS